MVYVCYVCVCVCVCVSVSVSVRACVSERECVLVDLFGSSTLSQANVCVVGLKRAHILKNANYKTYLE